MVNKKTNLKRGLFFLLLTIVLFSCSNQKIFDSEQELWGFINDPSNQYKQVKNINGIDFSLLYKPTDVLVAQELGGIKSDSLVNVLREKYGEYMYFNLSMSRGGKELLSTEPKNKNEFGAMVNQLAFGMEEKVHVYNSKKDTLELVDYVYPRMYGMSNSTNMLFVYPRDEKILQEENINFTVGDLGSFTGEVKFKIPIVTINKNIKIKFK